MGGLPNQLHLLWTPDLNIKTQLLFLSGDHPPYCLVYIHVHLILRVRDKWTDKAVVCRFIWLSASAACYLFPPGVPGGSRTQHGHCHLCGASPHSWHAAAVLLPLSDALCALWDGDRKAKSKWAREKDPIVEPRKTKYNRDRERRGERAKIEIGGSTKGVAGFTLTRRRPLGLFFNIMYRRVRTYNHIKMKRYRYTRSRYIYQLFSCNFTFGFLLTELWFSFISLFLLHTKPGSIFKQLQAACLSRCVFVWIMLQRHWEVWTKLIRNSGLIYKFIHSDTLLFAQTNFLVK